MKTTLLATMLVTAATAWCAKPFVIPELRDWSDNRHPRRHPRGRLRRPRPLCPDLRRRPGPPPRPRGFRFLEHHHLHRRERRARRHRPARRPRRQRQPRGLHPHRRQIRHRHPGPHPPRRLLGHPDHPPSLRRPGQHLPRRRGQRLAGIRQARLHVRLRPQALRPGDRSARTTS